MAILDSDLDSTYPGIRFAYDFVLPSYAWAQQRLDSVHGRIQTVQAFAATLFVAAPALAASDAQADFRTVPFLVAAGALFLVIVVGVVAREWGHLSLANPSEFYQDWLYKPEATFKKDAVFFAGNHFAHNRKLINGKSYAASAMTLLLLLEVLALAIWVVQST